MQINHRLTEICGISVADHIGRTVRETVPQVADQVEKIVEAVVRTGEPITGIEVQGQRADKLNAEHVWTTYWHPLKSPRNIVGVNVVAEEITERKRAEAVLGCQRKSATRKRSAISRARRQFNQFVWTADARAGFTGITNAGTTTPGPHSKKCRVWVGRRCTIPSTSSVSSSTSERVLKPAPFGRTRFLSAGRWHYRWFLSRALPIRNDAGEVIRWFGTNTDITEQIEAEKALRELNETLEQRVEVETENVSKFGMSHRICW